MVIYIKILKDDGNDDYYFPENYDEDDTELYFDVCGKDAKWDCYGLGGRSFEEWLGYYIDPVTLSVSSLLKRDSHESLFVFP